MKSRSLFLQLWLAIVFTMFSAIPVMSQTKDDTILDSLEISLLTCDPHQEIYSLYGHTAIRCRNTLTGDDFVVNYGVFNFNQPHFVLRFVFGLTDYSMGVYSFSDFKREYSYYKSSVTQQVLNLTPQEKANIMHALEQNARQPIYRYNYFYDNCTTRARDMLVNHLEGKVDYQTIADSTATFRNMIHSCNEEHPWARFGNDMLLGVAADRSTDLSEQQFLPVHLKDHFAHAVIIDADGQKRPLVSRTDTVVNGGLQVVESEFPLRPSHCFLLLLALICVVVLVEWKRHTTLWGFDLLLLLTAGLAGLVLTMMIFSHHPTVSFNLLILMLNPLPLLFAVPVARSAHKGHVHRWWYVWAALIVMCIAGGFFQKYAEGMYILALSLLIRCVSNIFSKGKRNSVANDVIVTKNRK